MPEWGYEYVERREKVYRGWYGVGAQMRISESCSRRGLRAVFPDSPRS
jgi:hypothetical protein